MSEHDAGLKRDEVLESARTYIDSRGTARFGVPDFEGKVDGGGYKTVMDNPKRLIELVPPILIAEIADVMTFGAKKYAPGNWMRGMSWSTVYGALQRHQNSWFMGEENDPDSGLPHMGHAGCCLAFLSHFRNNAVYAAFDDRRFKR